MKRLAARELTRHQQDDGEPDLIEDDIPPATLTTQFYDTDSEQPELSADDAAANTAIPAPGQEPTKHV